MEAGLGMEGRAGRIKGVGCRRRAGWRGGDLHEAGLEGGGAGG